VNAGTTSTFASLRQSRNYRLYFGGQAVSLAGTWMQTVAQGWLVLQLTGSSTLLGVVTACQFLPVTFLGPMGGVIVDRFDTRRLLIATQVAAGLLATILGVLTVTGAV
jgi:MFS family permease